MFFFFFLHYRECVSTGLCFSFCYLPLGIGGSAKAAVTGGRGAEGGV